MRQRETFLILLREWVTFRRQHEWQQTITTLSTIWFSIRVYGATFDNFSYRESIAHEIRNRHLNLTRSEFVYCFAARWNVSKMCFHITLASFSSLTHTLVLSLFQAENKRVTKWAQKSPKNAQLHSYTIYMHFIVIGNVSLFTLSDTFDCRLALSHSHTHTLCHPVHFPFHHNRRAVTMSASDKRAPKAMHLVYIWWLLFLFSYE